MGFVDVLKAQNLLGMLWGENTFISWDGMKEKIADKECFTLIRDHYGSESIRAEINESIYMVFKIMGVNSDIAVLSLRGLDKINPAMWRDCEFTTWRIEGRGYGMIPRPKCEFCWLKEHLMAS